MKFHEAMKHLEEGKSVRVKNWPLKDFWSFRQKGNLWVTISDLFVLSYKEWELYEEPKQTLTFAQVVETLKQGKRFRRKNWEKGYEIRSCNGRIMCGLSEWISSVEDFESTDWIEVK